MDLHIINTILLILIIPTFTYLLLWRYKSPIIIFDNLLREFHQHEQREKVVYDYIIEGIITSNMDGTIIFANKTVEIMFGYPKNGLLGLNIIQLVPQKYRDAHLDGIERAKRGEAPKILGKVINVEGLRKDGGIFPVALSVTKAPYDNSFVYTAIIRDITNSIKHQEAIQASEERFRLLVEGVRDYAIFLLDKNGYITTWNKGAERFKGYRANEIIGKHFSVFYPEAMRDRHWPEKELELSQQYGRWEDEGWRIRKDGSKFWANVVITPLYNDNKELIGFSKITRDLTERKLQEEYIHQLNLALEMRLAAAEAFNQTLSHDLNAPLRSIEGFSEIIEEDYASILDEKGKDYIKRMRKAVLRMRQLVKDMMKLAVVSNPNVQLNIAEMSLSNLFKSVYSEYKMTDPNRPAEVVIQEGMTINADESLMSLLVNNLFDNAWKFSSKKSETKIEIGFALVNNEKVYFIKDNGIGFDQSQADKLFKPFQRLNKEEGFDGSGVGLTIVKRVVDLHKGRVWAEGRHNEGATFYFTIGI